MEKIIIKTKMEKLTPKFLSSQPYFPEDSLQTVLREVEACLRSGKLTGGPYLESFERAFAEYNDVSYAVGVNSGTASLEVALRYFGVKDKEVIDRLAAKGKHGGLRLAVHQLKIARFLAKGKRVDLKHLIDAEVVSGEHMIEATNA